MERDEVPSADDESIDEDTTEDTSEGDDVEDEEGEEEDAAAEETPKVKETVWDWKLLNENKAIWLRPAGEITEEDYTNFYKAVGKVCHPLWCARATQQGRRASPTSTQKQSSPPHTHTSTGL